MTIKTFPTEDKSQHRTCPQTPPQLQPDPRIRWISRDLSSVTSHLVTTGSAHMFLRQVSSSVTSVLRDPASNPGNSRALHKGTRTPGTGSVYSKDRSYEIQCFISTDSRDSRHSVTQREHDLVLRTMMLNSCLIKALVPPY
ncbi:hypothetical protein EYF80_031886 [Liparis tanakae]|uniref:Uncharacterized protein n=1 Tax=Liparis tanakae TaxID=230148 RepID=A0A4Z2GW59_9TELE|nr:hypothetical protein EYF80_031886 [Liparis tanakae]